MKQKVINILKLALILLVPIFLQAFSSVRSSKRTIKKVDIHYVGSDNVYITDYEIRNLILQNQPENTLPIDELKIFDMEDRLDSHHMVANAEIYCTLDGILRVNVLQRKPIARIKKEDSFYYMDELGVQMPLSRQYSARVPLVSGNITDDNWDSTYKLLKVIKEDDFLEKNVIEIKVNSKDQYALRLRDPKFVVFLGDANHLKVKFDNLKAFYKKAEKDQLMNVYNKIDLQYENQVVASK